MLLFQILLIKRYSLNLGLGGSESLSLLSWYNLNINYFKNSTKRFCLKINVEENEDLLAPSEGTKDSLLLAKHEGCQLYIILISNGLQVSRLLRFGDRYRVLATRSKYVMLFDNRLFVNDLHYLWKRIINVIFIKTYVGQTNDKKKSPWYEITTVPFPSPIGSILIPRRLDIWTQNRFRKGVDLFRDKTADLRNQTLNVAAFAHLPGTAKNENVPKDSVRAQMGENETVFTGAEVEVIYSVALLYYGDDDDHDKTEGCCSISNFIRVFP